MVIYGLDNWDRACCAILIIRNPQNPILIIKALYHRALIVSLVGPLIYKALERSPYSNYLVPYNTCVQAAGTARKLEKRRCAVLDADVANSLQSQNIGALKI